MRPTTITMRRCGLETQRRTLSCGGCEEASSTRSRFRYLHWMRRRSRKLNNRLTVITVRSGRRFTTAPFLFLARRRYLAKTAVAVHWRGFVRGGYLALRNPSASAGGRSRVRGGGARRRDGVRALVALVDTSFLAGGHFTSIRCGLYAMRSGA